MKGYIGIFEIWMIAATVILFLALGNYAGIFSFGTSPELQQEHNLLMAQYNTGNASLLMECSTLKSTVLPQLKSDYGNMANKFFKDENELQGYRDKGFQIDTLLLFDFAVIMGFAGYLLRYLMARKQTYRARICFQDRLLLSCMKGIQKKISEQEVILKSSKRNERKKNVAVMQALIKSYNVVRALRQPSCELILQWGLSTEEEKKLSEKEVVA